MQDRPVAPPLSKRTNSPGRPVTLRSVSKVDPEIETIRISLDCEDAEGGTVRYQLPLQAALRLADLIRDMAARYDARKAQSEMSAEMPSPDGSPRTNSPGTLATARSVSSVNPEDWTLRLSFDGPGQEPLRLKLPIPDALWIATKILESGIRLMRGDRSLRFDMAARYDARKAQSEMSGEMPSPDGSPKEGQAQ